MSQPVNNNASSQMTVAQATRKIGTSYAANSAVKRVTEALQKAVKPSDSPKKT